MLTLGRSGLIALAFLGAFVSTTRADDARTAERAAQFEREIRPVLIAQCIQCHGEKKQEGGLRLDTREGLLQGGDSGAAVVEGNPDESLLIDALHHRSFEMPPKKKLADKIITHFERWVAGGAVWPETIAALRETDGNITPEDRQWWAFQKLRHAAPAHDPRDAWSQNELDRFVWNALTEKGMTPAPPAEREVLIRRLYFDLIGLPPTPQEIDAFVNDPSPAAWSAAVERLLEDRRYGEHWARFWLDIVRYAESDGWNQDAYRPYLWRYRDYVIDAFNSDKPYPQFVREQLAGDEQPNDPVGLTAAGFLRLGIYEYNQRDARGQWNDIMNEMTDVVGDAFLGMSMACARCHQHKFDPIPQRDYFKLRAFLEPVIWRDDLVAATAQQQSEYQAKLAPWETATAAIRTQLAALEEPYVKKKWASTVDKFPLEIQACFHLPQPDRTSWQEQMAYLISRQYLDEGGGPFKGMKKEDAERREELLKELATFDHLKPEPLPQVMTVCDFDGLVSTTYNPDDPRRTRVDPGYLEVLTDGHDLPAATCNPEVREGTTGRRTALAQWITHPNNPLTTRVIVNRVWQQHFGQGIVSTANDFGHLGDTPTHPELLDWLTTRYIDSGWSMKALHRIILTSATWQQSALHPEAAKYQSIDPGERLLWRSRVRRLQAEQIRDAMLMASGELKDDFGGPSVSQDVPRRSVYMKSFRNQNDTFLHGFDMANGLQSVPSRDTTTTPTQSLMLLNSKYVMDRGKALAKRLLDEHPDPETAIVNAFRWTWGTTPAASELEAAKEYVKLVAGEDASVMDAARFADLCHVLLNSNQFLYLE